MKNTTKTVSTEQSDLNNKVDLVDEIVIKFKNDFHSPGLKNYPFGACSDASLLFARYLTSLGYMNVKYMNGYTKGQTHAWLGYKDYIIDLTVKQFDTKRPMLLNRENDDYYKKFKNPEIRLFSALTFDRRTQEVLDIDYNIFLRGLDALAKIGILQH